MKKQSKKINVVQTSIAGSITTVRTVKDVWDVLNDLDSAVADGGSDLKRIKERVQINHQRIELIKVAVKAGALKSNQLRLTAHN